MSDWSRWRFVQALIDVRGETYRSAFGYWRMHEFTNGREDGGDGFIVGEEFLIEPGFEMRESPGQLPVRGEHLAQLHEDAHDVDAHLEMWLAGNRSLLACGRLGIRS
jgi:hypothetical protein